MFILKDNAQLSPGFKIKIKATDFRSEQINKYCILDFSPLKMFNV